MTTLLLVLALAIAGTPAERPREDPAKALGRIDTTFAVGLNASLEMLNTSGRITINTWTRAAIRIRSAGDADDPVEIQFSGGVVHLRTRSSRGVSRPSITIGPGTTVNAQVEVRRSGGPLPRADYDITVPAGMSLDVAGIYSDVSISGSRASVHATAVHGDLTLNDCRGLLSLENLEGQVRVNGAAGALSISAPNNAVHLTNTTGKASIASVNGGIYIEASSLSELEARTYNGSILYSGSVGSGPYTISTFNGTAGLRIAGGASATIEAVTVRGRIIGVPGANGAAAETTKRRRIVLGRGAARVKLQTFDGDIQIVTDKELKR